MCRGDSQTAVRSHPSRHNTRRDWVLGSMPFNCLRCSVAPNPQTQHTHPQEDTLNKICVLFTCRNASGINKTEILFTCGGCVLSARLCRSAGVMVRLPAWCGAPADGGALLWCILTRRSGGVCVCVVLLSGVSVPEQTAQPSDPARNGGRKPKIFLSTFENLYAGD